MKVFNVMMWVAFGASVASASTMIVYDPSPYYSERDSPFYGGIVDNTGAGIWVEDFEDHELNTPNVRAGGNLATTGNTYRTLWPTVPDGVVASVDGDDGVIDGQGGAGDTWIHRDSGVSGSVRRITFEFDPNENGQYPLYVGMVITQVATTNTPIEIGWKDSSGEWIYDTEFIARDWVPEGGQNGEPASHRFMGLYYEGGIATITMTNVSQADHLQYGFSIPEPGSGALLLMGLGVRVWRRKRESSRRQS